MQIGSGWTNKDDKGKVTGISFVPDKVILEMFPQLKNLKIAAYPIPPEQRTTETAPGWRLTVYKPEEKTAQTAQQTTVSKDEIPF